MKKGLLLSFCFLFLSCDLLNFTDYSNYVESLEFKNGKYYVNEDEMDVLYLTVSPPDAFNYLETVFTVDDESVCMINDFTNTYCFIKGVNEGTAIVTAELGNKKAKCIISVQKKDK